MPDTSAPFLLKKSTPIRAEGDAECCFSETYVMEKLWLASPLPKSSTAPSCSTLYDTVYLILPRVLAGLLHCTKRSVVRSRKNERVSRSSTLKL